MKDNIDTAKEKVIEAKDGVKAWYKTKSLGQLVGGGAIAFVIFLALITV